MNYTAQIREVSRLLNHRLITKAQANHRMHKINIKIQAGKGISHTCGSHCA